MTDCRRKPETSHRRGGLAPVELVLALPMFAMMMALMIVVGAAGAWKVRTLANSRQAAFRAMWPRTGVGDRKPDNWWPQSASMSFGDASPSPFPWDPFASHYVVRGPYVGSPAGGQALRVIDDTLDMTEGLHTGFAEVDREFPVWKKLPRRNHYRRDTHIFSGQQWQHGNMETPPDGDPMPNLYRRIRVTYEYDMARYDPQASARMMNALGAILSNPDRPVLDILDRDDELRTWYGDPYNDPYTTDPDHYNAQDRYDWLSVYPPATFGCDFNLGRRVDDLVERIEDVPRNLAQKFLRMYQDQLGAVPPPPNAGDLEEKIQQLQDFIATLP